MTNPSQIGAPLATPLLISRIILWLIWVGVLLAMLSFANVEAVMLSRPPAVPAPPPDMDSIRPVLIVMLVGGVVMTAAAFFVRWVLLRAAHRRQSFKGLLIAYIAGKLAVWFALAGTIDSMLVLVIIARQFMPMVLIAGIFWVALLADPPLFRPFRR